MKWMASHGSSRIDNAAVTAQGSGWMSTSANRPMGKAEIAAFFRFNPACGWTHRLARPFDSAQGRLPRREQARRLLSGHGAEAGIENDGEIADSCADPVGCWPDAEGAQRDKQMNEHKLIDHRGNELLAVRELA